MCKESLCIWDRYLYRGNLTQSRYGPCIRLRNVSAGSRDREAVLRVVYNMWFIVNEAKYLLWSTSNWLEIIGSLSAIFIRSKARDAFLFSFIDKTGEANYDKFFLFRAIGVVRKDSKTDSKKYRNKSYEAFAAISARFSLISKSFDIRNQFHIG